MKSLFNDNFAYSRDAQEISDHTYEYSIAILKKFGETGYSPREIAAILHGTISAAESEYVLSAALEKRKKPPNKED